MPATPEKFPRFVNTEVTDDASDDHYWDTSSTVSRMADRFGLVVSRDLISLRGLVFLPGVQILDVYRTASGAFIRVRAKSGQVTDLASDYDDQMCVRGTDPILNEDGSL